MFLAGGEAGAFTPAERIIPYSSCQRRKEGGGAAARTFGKGSDKVVDVCVFTGLNDGLLGGVVGNAEFDIVAYGPLVQCWLLRDESDASAVALQVKG